MKKLKDHIRIGDLDGLSDVLVQGFAGDATMQKDAFLKSAFAEMRTLSAQITEAIKTDKATSNLEEMDAVRDTRIRELASVIEGYANFPLPDMKEHGLALKAVFDKYGTKIAKESYARETSLVTSMLQDFDKPEITNHEFVLMGVREAIDNLRAAQDAFTTAQVEFAKSAAKDAQIKSASEIKKPLISVINDKVVPYLTMMANADSKFVEFATFVENRIEAVNKVSSGK